MYTLGTGTYGIVSIYIRYHPEEEVRQNPSNCNFIVENLIPSTSKWRGVVEVINKHRSESAGRVRYVPNYK